MTVQTPVSNRSRARPARPVHFPNESAEYRAAARRCWRRRSNFAGISSASPRSAGRCRQAARSLATIASKARRPIDFAGCSATSRRSRSTATCSGRSATPCPMCTNTLGAWAGNAADIGQRIALAVVARSPIERLAAWKRERGWRDLKLYSDLNGAYSRDYFGLLPNGSEVPSFNVFTRRDGTIRHFWGGEMTARQRWTRARIRAARPTRRRCGRCSTARRRVAARTGIRSSTTSSFLERCRRTQCA